MHQISTSQNWIMLMLDNVPEVLLNKVVYRELAYDLKGMMNLLSLYISTHMHQHMLMRMCRNVAIFTQKASNETKIKLFGSLD